MRFLNRTFGGLFHKFLNLNWKGFPEVVWSGRELQIHYSEGTVKNRYLKKKWLIKKKKKKIKGCDELEAKQSFCAKVKSFVFKYYIILMLCFLIKNIKIVELLIKWLYLNNAPWIAESNTVCLFLAGLVICEDQSNIINVSATCDFKVDCLNGSDEQECGEL